jgi:hypothetical protein
MQLPFVYKDKEKKGVRPLGGGDKRIEWYKLIFRAVLSCGLYLLEGDNLAHLLILCMNQYKGHLLS